jgi:hypothetical protein
VRYSFANRVLQVVALPPGFELIAIEIPMFARCDPETTGNRPVNGATSQFANVEPGHNGNLTDWNASPAIQFREKGCNFHRWLMSLVWVQPISSAYWAILAAFLVSSLDVVSIVLDGLSEYVTFLDFEN